MLVPLKSRHPAFRRIKRPSLAGEGMAVRLRSMSFALFGAGALFGLLLVAILAHPGFSLLPALPIPGLGSGGEAVSSASVVVRPSRPARARAELSTSAASPGSAAVFAVGHHRSAAHLAPTPPIPASGASSPPADGTPVGSEPEPAPVVTEPETSAAPAPQPASPTTVAAAPVATPSGGPSPVSNPIASGTDTGGDHGHHGHGPVSSPSHGHHGGPAPSSRPPGGPEALPETEVIVPAEGDEGSRSDHGHDHGHGDHSGHWK
jgi:hypothetical protein